MRVVKNPQSSFGQVDIASIQFNPRSRDDIPAILKGLQFIYVDTEIRQKVFDLLATALSSDTRGDTGRPGMEIWTIFVLATLKLGLGCDYDRLQELANEHSTLRKMLGHSDWEEGVSEEFEYQLQTLIDNVSLLKPEVLADVNQVVVETGHKLLKKKSCDLILKGRCDSFVLETNVHYPTDINLLWDAMRKLILQAGRSCEKKNIPGWRQYRFNLRQVKLLFRRTQKARYSNAKNDTEKAEKTEKYNATYQAYLDISQHYIDKAKEAQKSLAAAGAPIAVMRLKPWVIDAERQIDQINRRVLQGEKIPHEEKVFSLFERHTEWISKGKAGVPVELGVRVCVMEDQYQFILHHRVMWHETDDKVAVAMVTAAQQRYPDLQQCSFDKGFHSPENQAELKEILDRVVLPKKGRLSVADKTREYSEEFTHARHQHSAVESCINNLEQRGLDLCRSHGREGVEHYVSLAIVACNLHRIGLILQRKEREKLARAKRRKLKKLAA